VFVGSLSIDLLLGDVHSLKGKRAVIRPILAELARAHPVSVAEVGDQDLHRRALLGVAVVSGEPSHCRAVLDACERLVAGRPEIEILSTRQKLYGEDD